MAKSSYNLLIWVNGLKQWQFNHRLPSPGAAEPHPPLSGRQGMSCSPGPWGSPRPLTSPLRLRSFTLLLLLLLFSRPSLETRLSPGHPRRDPAARPRFPVPVRAPICRWGGGHGGGAASDTGLPSPGGGSPAPGRRPPRVLPPLRRRGRAAPGPAAVGGQGRGEARAGRAERSREAG